MARVVFHIGYPKTGTTSLQRCFLTYPETHYLGQILRDSNYDRPDDPRIAPSVMLVRTLHADDPARFEAALPELRKTIAGRIADGRPVIVSDETFSFAEFMKIARTAPAPIRTDHAAFAERLRRLWPGATILVCVREQKSFLISFYLQQLRTGMKLVAFEDYVAEDFAAGAMLKALRYDAMLDAYRQAFGDRVRVLAFESYKRRFGDLIAAAAIAAGIAPEGPVAAWGDRHENAREAQRWYAPVLHRALSQVARGLPDGIYQRIRQRLAVVPESVPLRAPLARRLDAYFAPSNRRLAEMTGIDLAALGYTVA
jgi:hypothetical protein